MSVRIRELRRDLLLEYLETVEASDAAAEASPRGKSSKPYWYALGKETAARRALELLELRTASRPTGKFRFDARALLEEARRIREESS